MHDDNTTCDTPKAAAADSLTEVLTIPDHGSESTSSDNPAPDACETTRKSDAPQSPRCGAGPGNLSALRTGKRTRVDRLVLADFPKAAKSAQARRDAWHRLAAAALKSITGKPLTFQQQEALRDAARFEAITLLAEHRRRQKGITVDQLESIESTIAAAVIAKGKLLAKLGLVPSDKPGEPDDAPTLADLADLDDEPVGSPASHDQPVATETTSEGENVAPCPGEKLPPPIPPLAVDLNQEAKGDAA